MDFSKIDTNNIETNLKKLKDEIEDIEKKCEDLTFSNENRLNILKYYKNLFEFKTHLFEYIKTEKDKILQ